MLTRLLQMYDSHDALDLVQIGILTIVIFALLRFLNKTGAAPHGRGLASSSSGSSWSCKSSCHLDLAELSACSTTFSLPG